MLDGGVDVLLPETSFDTLNMKAAVRSPSTGLLTRRTQSPGDGLGTIFKGGAHTHGQTLEAFWRLWFLHAPMTSVGLNFASVPDAAVCRGVVAIGESLHQLLSERRDA